MSKPKLDTEKIAKGLGAQKRGVVYATGGFPGAAQLAAEVLEALALLAVTSLPGLACTASP